MNNYGICNLAVVALREAPSHKSEMVNQLLFGELFEVKEVNKEWWYVQCIHDSYLGWLDSKQVILISEGTFAKINGIKPLHTTELVQLIYDHQYKRYFPIVTGSVIPYLNDKTFYIDEYKFSYEGETIETSKPQIKNIIETAQLYLNAPYLWGGRSPFGIDCSGFIQMVYKINGVNLKRDAYQQAMMGETLSFISDAHLGDVAFFDNEDGQIIHVGLIIGKNKIMHASGLVRIDTIDHLGIFNYHENKYTHKLRLIKRYIDE